MSTRADSQPPCYHPPMHRMAAVGGLLLSAALATAATRARPARPSGSTPAFSREIVRIFQTHCQTCHHPGDIAPFSLMTYDDARPYAQLIKLMTSTRKMPPWKPSDTCTQLEGERRMGNAEIDLVRRWVDAGAPEGNKAELPEPLTFDDGWPLGSPDAVGRPLQPFTPTENQDTYRCFPIDLALPSDRYVSAIDIRPGDRASVHHAIAFIDSTGDSRALDEADPGPGYDCFGGPGFFFTNALGGWAPGARPYFFPDGIALSLPASSRVVLQVHYHPTMQPIPDQTELAIYFASGDVKKVLRFFPLWNRSFLIPAGETNHRVTAALTLPLDIHAYSISPHMHLLGKSMRVIAKRPDADEECLIDIDDWEFDWQQTYLFQRPLSISSGTELRLEAFFDNSSSNPLNPNQPPKDIRWGEATTDEMCAAFIGFTIDLENLSDGPEAKR